MSTDRVDSYQSAMATHERAKSQVERIVKVISDAASKLRNYDRVGVTNSDVGFPAEVTFTGQSINGTEWPNAHQLAQALSEYHISRHEAENAWRAVPEATRNVLKEPPER